MSRTNHDMAVLAARVLLSVLFIVAGFGKLTGASGFAGFLSTLGFPAPLLVAYMTAVIELGGGLAILLGFRTRLVAAVLGAFCVATGLIAHLGPGEMNNFLKNLGLAGGFLMLVANGAGAISLDSRRAG